MQVICPPSGPLLMSATRPFVFLAGGITNCPDWQSEAIAFLKMNQKSSYRPGPSPTIFNPRRESFPIDDPAAGPQQVLWEYYALRAADIICFWFARGSLNPIVLFELGSHIQHKRIVVGADPEYARRRDVELQLRLARPALVLHSWHSFTAALWRTITAWPDAARPEGM